MVKQEGYGFENLAMQQTLNAIPSAKDQSCYPIIKKIGR